MADRPDPDRRLARQARLAAMVIAATALLWLGAQWLGGQFGWQGRYAFLFDFAALAAFVWALAVTWRIWRQRRSS
jgi:type VI protein secretion system component VasK